MYAMLLPHLAEEQSCVAALLAVLEQEAQALQNGLFSDLNPMSEKKAALLEQLLKLDQQREAAQLAHGFEPGRAGADAAAANGGEAVQAAWASLLAQAEKAREFNHRNGTMVFTHLDFTQKAINFLRGSSQPLYGPDGNRRGRAGAGARISIG